MIVDHRVEDRLLRLVRVTLLARHLRLELDGVEVDRVDGVPGPAEPALRRCRAGVGVAVVARVRHHEQDLHRLSARRCSSDRFTSGQSASVIEYTAVLRGSGAAVL